MATRPDVIMATGRSDFPNQINNGVCVFVCVCVRVCGRRGLFVVAWSATRVPPQPARPTPPPPL